MQDTRVTLKTNNWVDVMLPLVLAVTGLILIGGDRLGFLSLDRIQNLWPVALIVIGITDLLAGPRHIASGGRR